MNEEKTQIAATIDADLAARTERTAEAEDKQFLNQLSEALNTDPDFARAFQEHQEIEFQQALERSRANHDAFVKRYMGEEYEPKFSNAYGDATYFVSFYRTKKTANVAIPPIQMSGKKVEQLTPGRLYACSGYEARMLERVLASKKIEVLNITPKRDGYAVEFGWIVENWPKLFPTAEAQAASIRHQRPMFGYRDNLHLAEDIDQQTHMIREGETAEQAYARHKKEQEELRTSNGYAVAPVPNDPLGDDDSGDAGPDYVDQVQT